MSTFKVGYKLTAEEPQLMCRSAIRLLVDADYFVWDIKKPEADEPQVESDKLSTDKPEAYFT